MKRSLIIEPEKKEETFKKVKIRIKEEPFSGSVAQVNPGGGSVPMPARPEFLTLPSIPAVVQKQIKVEPLEEAHLKSPEMSMNILRRGPRMSERLREKELKIKQSMSVDTRHLRKIERCNFFRGGYRPKSRTHEGMLWSISSIVRGERITLRRVNFPRLNVDPSEPKVKKKKVAAGPALKLENEIESKADVQRTVSDPFMGHYAQNSLDKKPIPKVKLEPTSDQENSGGIPQQFLLTADEAAMLSLFSSCAARTGGKSRVCLLLAENRRLRAALKAAQDHEQKIVGALEAELKVLQEAHKAGTLPPPLPQLVKQDMKIKLGLNHRPIVKPEMGPLLLLPNQLPMKPGQKNQPFVGPPFLGPPYIGPQYVVPDLVRPRSNSARNLRHSSLKSEKI